VADAAVADIGPDGPEPDAAAPDTAPPDAPPDAAAPDTAPPPDAAPDADPGPRWETLGQEGLVEHLALNFELRIADDGTPFLALSKPRPPSSRLTIVLRYDGSDWQQVGGDLPGNEVPPGFVLARNGTPYVLTGGVLYVFRGETWDEVTIPPPPTFIPAFPPVGLARDDLGRIYTFVGNPSPDRTGYLLGLMRLDAGSWQLLGAEDSFFRIPTSRDVQLAADRDSPIVADSDLDEVFTDIRRWNGRDWVAVGGGTFEANRGVLMAAPDGQTYFAPPGGLPIKRGSATAAWVDLPERPTALVDVAPSLAVGSDGLLHVAYLADRDPGPAEVPGPVVSRLEGDRFADLPAAGLEPDTIESIKLQIGRGGGTEALHVAYSRELRIVVKRFRGRGWPGGG
jgi:hypothetical protein